jgi:Chaperone of endosialidase
MKTKTSLTRNSMNRTPLRALLLIPLTLICFALSPQARAVCQEGCLRNDNTAIGTNALINTTGSQNTANGFQALFSNTIGNSNTATGWEALTFNTTGNNNTATGTGSLQFNITGTENTATGVDALFSNTTGTNNTASGAFALSSDTTGSDNTATGEEALEANTTGHDNTANGTNALLSNITGSSNIAIGSSAGLNLTTGSNNIDIGNAGVAAEANTIRIGTQGTQTKTFIAGVSGTAVAGSAVTVNSNGQIGVAPSSVRFKEKIQPMDKTSEVILELHPVTFRYKHELDPAGIPQFGLVAEEVEKVDPDLVARDKDGKPYTVRYEAVNAMLLNEFLKARRQIDAQQKQIDALTAGLQKVSAQLELGKPAPQTVLNNH